MSAEGPSRVSREKLQRSSRRALQWLLGIGLFLAILPELVRLALIEFLPDTGIGQVAIDDIDINLFTVAVGVDGLVISRDGEEKLALDRMAVDLAGLKLLVAEIHFDSINIDGLRVPVQQLQDGSWEVVVPLAALAADDAPEAADSEEETGLELPKVLVRALDVHNVAFTIDSPLIEGVFNIDELVLQEASSWLLEPATLTLKARWKDAPIELYASARPWIDLPEADGKLTVHGYQMGTLSTALGLPVSGDLDLSLDFSLQDGSDGIVASVPLSLQVKQLSSRYKTLQLQQQSLDLSAQIDVTLRRDKTQPYTFAVAADLVSEDLSIQDTEHNVLVLGWERYAVDKLQLDQAVNVRFDSMSLNKLIALETESETDRLYTESINLSDGKLESGSRFHLKEAVVSAGEYSLDITPEGGLHFQGVISQLLDDVLPEPAAEEVAVESAESTSAGEGGETQDFSFGIDKLTVGDKTRLSVADHRFSPPVRQDVFIQSLVVQNLDQAQPEAETRVDLTASVGEFGALTATGTLKPFADDLMVDLKGEVQALELTTLSPYSEAYLGYQLTRGQYDHKFDVDIHDQKIDLNNKLTLRQLELESVDPDKPQPIEKLLDVPLGLALDMLRDSNNNIELKMPIKGRLDDPNININSVINKALAKALRSGATSYLKFALQPYGAVLMAADFVGDQITAVRLEPVTFDAGEEAAPAESEYLEKLEKLLAERPALDLTLCGRANAADREVLLESVGDDPKKLQAALLKLAEQRGRNLKRLFIEKGVESRRLLLCQAQYEEGGVSGVQLQM